VQLVLRGGRALYGNADWVAKLQAGCSALTVCGSARSVCFDADETTLDGAQKATAPIYPLFFCKPDAPTDEPSCTPYRETYASGVTQTDGDGDGVPDVTDNCPLVFNPARPLDGTSQADVDGDLTGDACDRSPLDAAVH
jgi:hypothetical protein